MCQESFRMDVNNICWIDVYKDDHTDDALAVYERLFCPLVDKHVPMKKQTMKNVGTMD